MNTIKELKERFDNLTKIKKGGQKSVYKAILNKKIYALKIVSCPNDPRVMQEIDIAQKYDIPYVPKIIESGSVLDEDDKENSIYIIEEFIDGISLRDYIDSGNKFNLQKASNVLGMLLKIECCLEKLLILHRDINPNNIMLLENNEIRLIDFGLAKILGKVSFTRTNSLYGPFTPGYAPTEQVSNMKLKQDSRTDLFQIGVTIYESITGNNPFINKKTNGYDIYDILAKTANFNPPSLHLNGDINGFFNQFIFMLMAKNQSQRPETAAKAYEYFTAIKKSLKVGA